MDKLRFDTVTDLIFLCQIYKKNLKVLYYDRSLEIKIGEFILNDSYSFINLSLLTPAKIETFYTKEFIANAGVCQGLINDIIEKALPSGDIDESIDESHIQIYKNIEFVLWKADQKRILKDVSSILDSLNESRDDSIESSIFSYRDDASSSGKSKNGHLKGLFGNSSIDNTESEVASVFNMGTEKFMGSEKHYMSDKFDYSESNFDGNTIGGMSSVGESGTKWKAPKTRPNRGAGRSNGFVKMSYTGKASVPVNTPQVTLNPSKKKAYTGAGTYTGPQKDSMVSENELNNSKRLHDYSTREGEGVPLHTFDEKKEEEQLNKTAQSDKPANFSLFAAMNNHEKEKVNSLKKERNIKEGRSNLKEELEIIEEEKTKSDAITDSKTLGDTTPGDSSRTRHFGKNSNTEGTFTDTSLTLPHPDGILKELQKEDLIKKLLALYGNNQPVPQQQQQFGYPYQMPYPSTHQMPPMPMPNIHQDLSAKASTSESTLQSTITKPSPGPENTQNPIGDGQKNLNNTNMTNLGNMTNAGYSTQQPSMHQYPMYQPQQMYYPQQVPPPYYPYQYPPQHPPQHPPQPQMHYNMPPPYPYQGKFAESLIYFIGQMMMPNNQYVGYQNPGYGQPFYPPNNQYYPQEQMQQMNWGQTDQHNQTQGGKWCCMSV